MGTRAHQDRGAARQLLGLLAVDDRGDLPAWEVAGHPVEVQRIRGIDALTARLPAGGLPHDPEALVALLGDHERVLRSAAAGRCLVPMPFGTVAGDLHQLERMIDARCVEILDALQRVEGCDEWGVHVSVPRHAPQRAVRSVTAHAYDRLAVAAEDAVIEPIEARAGEPRPSALSAAFLVNRDRLALFQHTAGDLCRAWDGVGMSVRLSGPWPCYDFARLDLGGVARPEVRALLGPLSSSEGCWTATAPRTMAGGAVR